ncbi:hypothetical protein RIB2604_01800380 [Aspergillus luchuensis]|uniref:Uncharacterized protein n=1 Tax=Aspergillus kawachii TaxID=1069201 RepID=A0A146FFI2_ASPKA|nr:hypothetical protein RIB2604_01800380 [Aspergillus luchuensis]
MFYNPLAITASSLDLHPSHSLPERIRAAASASSLAIETVYQELEDPFKNFEGHELPLEERLARARNWLEIAACLKAKYLQVPSQFDTGNSSGDWTRMVGDLQALSDLAASYSVGIAYEAVA